MRVKESEREGGGGRDGTGAKFGRCERCNKRHHVFGERSSLVAFALWTVSLQTRSGGPRRGGLCCDLT